MSLQNYLADKYVKARNNSHKATIKINNIKSKKNWEEYEHWRKEDKKWGMLYYRFIHFFNLKEIIYVKLK